MKMLKFEIFTFFLVSCLLIFVPSVQAVEQVVEVNLGQNVGPVTRRGLGMINGLVGPPGATRPSPDLIAHLRLKFIRTIDYYAEQFLYFDKTLGADVEVHFTLGSPALPAGSSCPGDGGNWASWESYVKNRVYSVSRSGAKVRWDIWNEPDLSNYWPCSDEQFFELWKRAYRIIRSTDPTAKIVGPGISSTVAFNRPYMLKFLTYAKSNNVVPDVLAWHELTDRGADQMATNIPGYRQLLSELGLSRLEMEVNETMGINLTLQPGKAVQFFAVAERQKISGIARACWSNVAECFNMSLNGLLTGPAGRPRAIYWAYRLYAGVTGNLVKLIPSASVDGVAGVDSVDRRANVLLGNHKTDIDVQVRVKGIGQYPYLVDGSGLVHVKALLLPNSGIAQLDSPRVLFQRTYQPNSGEILVDLPVLKSSEAVALVMCSMDNCVDSGPPPPPKKGDANLDGKVDGVDYQIWKANYRNKDVLPYEESKGNFNDDRISNGIDYVIWLKNKI